MTLSVPASLLATLLVASAQDEIALNLALHAADLEVAGSLVTAFVDERASGETDLNGDGDTFDVVVHVYDADTAELVNLGLAGARPSPSFFFQRPIASDGRFVTFGVSESEDGGEDLNGDGDSGDHVLHLYDHLTQEILNLQVAVQVSRIAVFGGTKVFFLVDEASQGTDLNEDGDLLDSVAHTYDLSSAILRNLELAVFRDPFSGFDVLADTFAFAVGEADQGGQDRNGDGDAVDRVVALHQASTGRTTNLGLAVRLGFSFSGGFGPPYASDGAPLPILVAESEQGKDLNGDGDIGEFDWILHLVDLGTLQVFNSRLAAAFAQASPGGRFVVTGVSEQGQRGRDLNGDGDRVDYVLHQIDTDDDSITNLRLVGFLPRFVETLEGDLLLLLDVPEAQRAAPGSRRIWPGQDAGDLNGDGDELDTVLLVYDLERRRVHSADLATADSTGGFAGNPVSSDLVGLRASETDQAADENADGDTEDIVVQLFDAGTRTISNTGLAVFCCDANLLGSFLEAYRSKLVIPVHEASQGSADLNADGDALDHVLHVHDAASGASVNLGLAVDRLHIVRDGGLFAFVVREAWQGGVDLNGDGDAFDSILHVLDLR